MTVIVFLIDTSASMMQKQYLGTTLLDFARLTVEQFLKHRQRDPASAGDRYMLMTFEEYPFNIKSGWKESQRMFNEQLKGLRAKGVSNFEQSVESVMRLLTINRMQTGAGAGIENYGFGRFPSYAEHVVIVPVVDGSELPVDDPAAQVPKPRLLVGNDFTAEAFRWDQRMFPIVLRLGGHQRTPSAETAPAVASSPLALSAATDANGGALHNQSQQQQQYSQQQSQLTVPLPDRSIAETFAVQMGGRSFAITSHRMLFQCIDTIMQRIQSNGVLVRFRQHGPDPSPPPPPTATATAQAEDAQQQQKKDEAVAKDSDNASTATASGGVGDGSPWADSLVLVKAKLNAGPSFWPIPEAFWPDTVRNSLPARSAHPVVLFRCERSEAMFNPEFPLDKYELDSTSPLAQQMLSRRESNLCWQVFVEGSFKQPGIGLPFGYLKVSSSSTVNLLVMPYNYPDLLTLLAQAKEGPKMVASVPFQQRFDKYLNTVPPYYFTYLKKQLSRLKIAPPSLEEANTKLYGYINLGTHHAKMKQQGVQEFEFATMAVQKCLSDPTNANVFGANPASFVKLSRARALLGKAMPMTAECLPSSRPALGLLPSMQQQQTPPQMLPPGGGADLTIFVSSASACPSSAWSSPAASATVPPSQLFKNPFDIPRANLCAQLDKMRINFEQQVRSGGGANGTGADVHVFQGGPPGQKIKLQHVEDLACLPISKMGIYEDYVKSLIAIGLGPKRELEPQAARPHAFGNPFKLDKKSNMYIADEVGEMNAGASTSALPADVPSSSSSSPSSNGSGGGGRRRRAASEAGTMATAGVRPPRRRPGPIDPSRLALWRRRRRSSSVLSCPDEAVPTTAATGGRASSAIGLGVADIGDDRFGTFDEEQAAPLRMAEEEEEEEDDRMAKMVKREHGEEEEKGHEETMGEEDEEEYGQQQRWQVKEESPDEQQQEEEMEEYDEEDEPELGQQRRTTTTKMMIAVEEEEGEQEEEAVAKRRQHRRQLQQRRRDSSTQNNGWGETEGAVPAPTAAAPAQRAERAGSTSSATAAVPFISSLTPNGTLPTMAAMDAQREIRQIVRLKGPSNFNLAERVASVAAGVSASRKRSRELLELAIAEARRFKRVKLCELIGQQLQQQHQQGPDAPATTVPLLNTNNNNNASAFAYTAAPTAATTHQNGFR